LAWPRHCVFELEKSCWRLGIKHCGTRSSVLANSVLASRRQCLWILVGTSSREIILAINRHSFINNFRFHPHWVPLADVEFWVIIFICPWHFQGLQWDVSFRWNFLHYLWCTYLDNDIENPLLVFLLSSKIVLSSYLEEPGETVRSLVKSDFLP
jgi:hypothetical protein